MTIQRESELYVPIKDYFEQQGWQVKGEVKGCDAVAYREQDAVPLIVELKKTFNLSLLMQGMRRQKLSPQVYLAVEYNERGKKSAFTWDEASQLCAKLGLGLISVQFFKRRQPEIRVHCHALADIVPSHRRPSRKRKRLAKEFAERSADFNIGGIQGTELVTAYREKALHCAYLLSFHGPLSTKALRELTENEKIALLLQHNVYGWFERIKRGTYGLTEKGAQALETYTYVIEQKQSSWLS